MCGNYLYLPYRMEQIMKNSDIKYDTGRDYGSDKVMPKPPTVIPVPEWKPFTGFSFLFDNPGDGLIKDGYLLKLSGDLNNSALRLYRSIADAVEIIDKDKILAKQYEFFTLPPSTYHVTVWDGVNIATLKSLNKECQDQYDLFFQNLLASQEISWPPLLQESRFHLRYADASPIRFKYKDLRSRGTTVVVVELEPADSASKAALEQIVQIRNELDELFAEYGKPKNYDYRPHVAVGYFSDDDNGNRALYRHMDQWIEAFDEILHDEIIEFNSVSLYGFTDMITYFKPTA